MANQTNENFFRDVYHRTEKTVLTYIISKCNNMDDVSDIFQETYLEFYKILLRKGQNYFHSPDAIIMQLAKRKIYRHYFFAKPKMQKICLDDVSEEELAKNHDLVFSIPEDYIVNKNLINKVNQFLETKDLTTQKIFYLHYYLELTITEISNNISLPESTIKSRLYRTLRELEEILK